MARGQISGGVPVENDTSLHAGARKALVALQAKRAKTSAAARAPVKSDKRRKAKDGLPMVDQLVSKEAQRHGDYRPVDFEMADREERGKAKAKTVRVVRNVGQTQIDRWSSRGRLDERQLAAILFYQAAWAAHIGEPRVTANYCPAVRHGANQAVELWASSRMRAKMGLRLLDVEVFYREPIEHFWVWQNVVIWNQAAGVAGEMLGYTYKPAEAVAQHIVKSIASKVADIVIDSSRKDFGDLLLDLDAPRKPGRRAA